LIVGDGQAGYPELIYDPAHESFHNTGPTLMDPQMGSVAPLANGKVLIAGGAGNSDGANSSTVSHLAELFDPSTGKFSKTGAMHTYREGLTSTTLQDGRVLVAGGDKGDLVDGAGPLASAELYDPKSGKFMPTGSMHEGRTGATATLLASGKVLIVGGQGADGQLSSAELYNPQTGEFTLTGSMATGRLGHTSTLLKDGRVLIVGGSSTLAGPSAEIYDPATGAFGPARQPTASRDGHSAALLKDGRVLIAGGDSTGVSAELYWP
jgi:N-acetylneuraminic acid mutarotase